jgi:hypothetical protein
VLGDAPRTTQISRVVKRGLADWLGAYSFAGRLAANLTRVPRVSVPRRAGEEVRGGDRRSSAVPPPLGVTELRTDPPSAIGRSIDLSKHALISRYLELAVNSEKAHAVLDGCLYPATKLMPPVTSSS